MTLRYPLLLLLLAMVRPGLGQRTFTVATGSARYSATITVASCADGHCEGAGTIKLYTKQPKQLVQTFTSADLSFYLDAPGRQPTVNTVELYGEQSPLIFGDFNFDGTEDLAVRNGNHSSYDGPSYDVYVCASRTGRFIRSAELTSLASDNLGMFQVDKARKRLITFQKDGCCWHLTTEYAVVPGQGLREVMTLEEDARGGETVTVRTRRRTNGRWTSTTRTYPLKEYYKD